MTERTVAFMVSTPRLRVMHKGRLTALRNDDGFDLMIRQTHSVDAHVPVRSERSAHSEEQEDTHGGE